VADRIGGTALRLDVPAPGAPKELIRYLDERFGGVDIVVHNARLAVRITAAVPFARVRRDERMSVRRTGGFLTRPDVEWAVPSELLAPAAAGPVRARLESFAVADLAFIALTVAVFLLLALAVKGAERL